ncbi:hypothetical protein [Aquimarina sediminis]|uniref:hypothetical protein n=1 Tax=Aquimarina sediminis TaxID=2070536 RepID=UPI000CA02875|nr:hypothetical protein [Aquimarina sediminis]
MSKEILLAAFLKAKNDSNSSKKTHQSQYISDVLWSKYKFKIDERTLRDYYNSYIKGEEHKELKPIVTKHLCKFLGYDDYEDFLKNKGDEKPLYSPPKRPKKINFVVLFLIGILCIVLYLGVDWKRKECMTWSEDHYELAICPKSFNPSFIPIDNERLKEFKKIKVDTNYTFFNDKGKAIVWYDKKEGKIEFFNKSGTHPTNGNSLKPVTQAIVRKYVFGEE